MKKSILIGFLVIGTIAGGIYYVYRTLVPELVAKAVLSEKVPEYIPKRILSKVEEIRTPINKGAGALIEKMHDSKIPVNDVIETVDKITEEQAYAFLDEINQSKPETTDEVFDLVTKHFPTTFNPEVLRQPFNEYFDVKQIRKLVVYANMNRTSKDVDFTTAKAIVKQIIIEKDREMAAK